jgi:hypothetical protein
MKREGLWEAGAAAVLCAGAFAGWTGWHAIKADTAAAKLEVQVIEEGRKSLQTYFESSDYHDLMASIGASISGTVSDSGSTDLTTSIIDAMTGDDDTTSSSESAETSQAKDAAKDLTKTDDTASATIKKWIMTIAGWLPSWIPAREYIVAGAFLALIVWLIMLAQTKL